MLKKIIFGSMLLLATTSVFADEPMPYVGANVGLAVNTNPGNNFRGIPLGVLAGYGGQISSSLYLAGEVFVTIITPQLDSNGNVKSNYNYGISLLPGMFLSQHTMGYLRLSLVKTHFPQLKTTKTGGQLGVGVQTSMTQSFDVRGEYIFSRYSGSLNTDQFNIGLIYKFM